jgi:predicted lipoprotein with Yx(FWY)xxD motif
MRHWLVGATGAMAVGLLATACSGGSTSSSSSSPSSTPSAPVAAPPSQASSPTAAATSVSLATVSGVPDKALVAGNGRALYLFVADKNGKSTCSTACAAAWPPDIVTGTPQAGTGVKQSLLGTVKRADGTTQLTYNKHPLYFFVGDSGPGTAAGQGMKAFGANWYVLNGGGSKIDDD